MAHIETVADYHTETQIIMDDKWDLFSIKISLMYCLNKENKISEIKNNAWVTVNNDFWVTSEAICQ